MWNTTACYGPFGEVDVSVRPFISCDEARTNSEFLLDELLYL